MRKFMGLTGGALHVEFTEQYIENPNGFSAPPYSKANLPNAWVFGLQFRVALK